MAAVSSLNAFSSESGRVSQTKYILKNSATHVRVTRRHHPLQGQTYEVLKYGKVYVLVRLPNGSTMKLPRHWTDVDGLAPYEEMSGDAFFTVESLRELLKLEEALRRRS